MEAVRVKYTVRAEFADENKANIQKVMEALRAKPIEGMQYASFTVDDGHTFVHINMARDEATMSKLSELPEFNEFRAALKASEPVTPPESMKLNLVGAGFEL